MFFLILLFLATVFGSPLDQRLNPVRIVGGHDANITDYPYQVAVVLFGTQRCGGAILSNTTILTSAYCFLGNPQLNYVQIRAGSTNRSEGGELINVTKVTSHPKYNFSVSFQYDVAVIELETPLTYKEGIQPIQLPNNSTTLKDGQNGTITGWGANNTISFTRKEILQVINVPLVATETCKDLYGIFFVPGAICAGGSGKDGCYGDSGGPLVIDGILQGIISFETCALNNLPSLYTDVSKYLDFIIPFLKQ